MIGHTMDGLDRNMPTALARLTLAVCRQHSFYMNGGQIIRTAGLIVGFCMRHFLALLVTVTVAGVFWTMIYFALLMWAVLTDGGIGSPATYPIGLLIVLVGSVAVASTIFFPATALAEWFVRRRDLPMIAQIPLAVVILAVICLLIVGLAAAVAVKPTFTSCAIGFVTLYLIQLPPFGVYWLAAQCGPLFLSLFRFLRHREVPVTSS